MVDSMIGGPFCGLPHNKSCILCSLGSILRPPIFALTPSDVHPLVFCKPHKILRRTKSLHEPEHVGHVQCTIMVPTRYMDHKAFLGVLESFKIWTEAFRQAARLISTVLPSSAASLLRLRHRDDKRQLLKD